MSNKKVLFFSIFLLGLFSCTSYKKLNSNRTLSVYVYPSGHFTAANKSIVELEKVFRDITSHVGDKTEWGQVGVGLVFPYLRWTEGSGVGPYMIPKKIKEVHEKFLIVAKKLNMPVLVQFNGAVWHSPGKESSFLNYWKMKDNGKYLSRYSDGKVNKAIDSKNIISTNEIKKYLDVSPYDKEGENTLFFTLSKYAVAFHRARIQALSNAVVFWQGLDGKYPGTIKAFTTDSEVSNFSFRVDEKKKNEIPIGYEDFITVPFCKKYQIKKCKEYFLGRTFDYDELEDRRWHDFRADLNKQFVQSTVSAIRRKFPARPIYTHQIPVLDGTYTQKYKNRDYGSPQSTAFVKDSFPGFTVYIYGKRDKRIKQIIKQVHSKAGKTPWGFMEFNPGKQWKGSKKELSEYTHYILSYGYQYGVDAIAPLSWISNSLDTGIRGSGVDEGIKRFLEQGPLPIQDN